MDLPLLLVVRPGTAFLNGSAVKILEKNLTKNYHNSATIAAVFFLPFSVSYKSAVLFFSLCTTYDCQDLAVIIWQWLGSVSVCSEPMERYFRPLGIHIGQNLIKCKVIFFLGRSLIFQY